jgi:hypothetical protein
MKTRILIASLAAMGVALSVGQMSATALPGKGGAGNLLPPGPDVIVGGIPDVAKYGSNTVNGVSIMAYAFGSTSCNIGNVNLRWWQNTPYHPVIPQNAYRIKGGRIEQVGIGWMKHGFCALQENLCSVCQPGGIGCGSATSELGVGCSDPYTAGLNGNQGDLGPRYEVNPTTGSFPATGSTSWPGLPSGQGTIARRLQIRAEDLNPSLNTGSVYLAEAMYVHPDDAAANNDNNNASYRVFTVGALTGGAYNLSLVGSTYQMKPAIYHWPIVVPSAQVLATDGPDGRWVVGSNVTRNVNGTYRYEFAVFNMNSDSAGASFGVPLPNAATVANVGFRDVSYHSGEPYDGADWSFSVSGGVARWQCTQTAAQNPNANALRWGTMYNFWFDSNAAPAPGNSLVGLFKTGETVFAASRVPFGPCGTADLDCSDTVDGADLGLLLAGWGPCGNPCPADLDGSGQVDGADLGLLLSNWG